MRSNTKAIVYHQALSWISWIHLQILLWLTVLHSWIFRGIPSFTLGQTVGTLIVVGDDVAYGHGDSILKRFMGVSSYLEFYLKKERKLKTNWKILNFGWINSSSRTWLPSCNSNFYKNLENLIIDKESTIILLFIGSNDVQHGISLQESVYNIKEICKEFSRLGVQVFLSTIPTWGDEGMEQDLAKTRRGINQSIRDLISSGEFSQLYIGVDLDSSNFEYRVLNLYTFDGIHFSNYVLEIK